MYDDPVHNVVFGRPVRAGATDSLQVAPRAMLAVRATWPPDDATDAGVTLKALTAGAGSADWVSFTELEVEWPPLVAFSVKVMCRDEAVGAVPTCSDLTIVPVEQPTVFGSPEMLTELLILQLVACLTLALSVTDPPECGTVDLDKTRDVTDGLVVAGTLGEATAVAATPTTSTAAIVAIVIRRAKRDRSSLRVMATITRDRATVAVRPPPRTTD